MKFDLHIFHTEKFCHKPYCNADSPFHVGKKSANLNTHTGSFGTDVYIV